eukprot:2514864-Prorocentrum_lima.AAC.1
MIPAQGGWAGTLEQGFFRGREGGFRGSIIGVKRAERGGGTEGTPVSGAALGVSTNRIRAS